MPRLLSGTFPKTFPLSKNVISPVGIPCPVGPVTVALNPKSMPYCQLLTPTFRVVVLTSGVMFTAIGFESLPANVPSPANRATRL